MWDQYDVNGVFDEMFVERGHPRPHYAAVLLDTRQHQLANLREDLLV